LPDFSTINRIINPKTALFVHFQITQKAATFEESLFDPPNLDHSSDQSNKLVLQLAPPKTNGWKPQTDGFEHAMSFSFWGVFQVKALHFFGCISQY